MKHHLTAFVLACCGLFAACTGTVPPPDIVSSPAVAASPAPVEAAAVIEEPVEQPEARPAIEEPVVHETPTPSQECPPLARQAPAGHWETRYYGFRGRRSQQVWVPASSGYYTSGGCASCGR